MQNNTLSVKQLNLYVRSLIEGDIRLANIAVKGEISNFKNHYSSGHLYFTLKDNDASIRCVMFKWNAQKIRFDVQDGLQVILRGKVSLYEKDGQYQFYVEDMLADGMGDIALKFEQIKQRLEAEGMFDLESKRPIPKFPKRIAVVTSATGAAVQDIINILSRRWPIAEIVMCPVAVQGELAVPQMLDTLERIYNTSAVDVIIIGRGGGSIEDLWAFNDESLARKIYESPVPVISAVGHETDFTICDFVADLRAPTPSAAAELAVPDVSEIRQKIEKYTSNIKNSLISKYKYCDLSLKNCLNSQYINNPVDAIINQKSELCDRYYDKLTQIIKEKMQFSENMLSKNASTLDALSPLKVLSRGFTAIQKEDKVVSSVKDIESGDTVSVKFIDGIANCNVTEIIKEEANG